MGVVFSWVGRAAWGFIIWRFLDILIYWDGITLGWNSISKRQELQFVWYKSNVSQAQYCLFGPSQPKTVCETEIQLKFKVTHIPTGYLPKIITTWFFDISLCLYVYAAGELISRSCVGNCRIFHPESAPSTWQKGQSFVELPSARVLLNHNPVT